MPVRSVVPGTDAPDLNDLFVLPQPVSVCQLLLTKCWSKLIALGRWAELSASLPEQIQEQICPAGSEDPQPSQVDLTASSCRELANHIRRWSVHVLACVQDVESERTHLEAAVRWLDNVSWSLPQNQTGVQADDDFNVLNRSRHAYSSLFMVKMLLLMRVIPGSVDVKHLLIDAVSLLFPHLLKSVCEQLLTKPNVFPSPGTRHQARLVLDAALLLWRRAETGTYVRFGGADASPQAGFDFLLSSTDYILQEQIVPLFQAVRRMMKDASLRLEGLWEEQSPQSVADHQLVRKHLRKEDDIPIALGNAATSATHKVAGMLHKYSLRCESEESLAKYLSSFFSFCSDMGTEMNISSFRIPAQKLQELLPVWMKKVVLDDDDVQGCQWRPLLLENDVCSVNGSQPGQSVPGASSVADSPRCFDSATFLPQALAIPGMLHITSNGLEQVTQHLVHFDEWFGQLKVIESLWKNGRLVRFVNFCVRPAGAFASEIAADFLRRKPGSLYLKRWNEVSKFCLRIKDLLPSLKAFWDQKAFSSCKSSVAGADAEFDPCLLTSILQDPMFEARLDWMQFWGWGGSGRGVVPLGRFLLVLLEVTYTT